MWLLPAALAALASPCDCSPAHPAERVLSADLVFTATVLPSAYPNVEYSVLRRYKGKPPARMRIYDLAEACKAASPRAGREYLVLARRSAGVWVMGPCEGAIPVEESQKYLSYLGGGEQKRPPRNLVTGQVLFPQKMQVPVLVRLKRGSSINYATADEAGLFAFENVPAGEYSLEAVARGFVAAKNPVIRVPAKGIARAWIPMESERARRR